MIVLLDVPDYIFDLVEFIWTNRFDLVRGQVEGSNELHFCHPNYGGLPPELWQNVSYEMVRFIQNKLPFNNLTKEQVRDILIGYDLIKLYINNNIE